MPYPHAARQVPLLIQMYSYHEEWNLCLGTCDTVLLKRERTTARWRWQWFRRRSESILRFVLGVLGSPVRGKADPPSLAHLKRIGFVF